MSKADEMATLGLKDRPAAKALSDRFRKARDRSLRDLIGQISARGTEVRILDMGGTVDYWRRVGFAFLRSKLCHVTIVNIHEVELGVDAEDDLMCLSVGDATNLHQYEDGSFDLTHSNSVIEHLGSWDAMRRFAAEAQRLGRVYYLQTPNFWFPIDPHYYTFPLFHWLPRPMRAALFRRFAIAQAGRMPTWDAAFAATDASRLLVRPQLRSLFPDAEISSERLFGLTKSLVVTGPREALPVGTHT